MSLIFSGRQLDRLRVAPSVRRMNDRQIIAHVRDQLDLMQSAEDRGEHQQAALHRGRAYGDAMGWIAKAGHADVLACTRLAKLFPRAQ